LSVRLRLSRAGTKKSPFYHLVIADQRAPRDGRFIEQVGTYDPRKEPSLHVNEERVAHWIGKGVQPTEAVADILRRAKTTAGKAAQT
jgi:small subunit ribosomal protein S16